MTVSDNIWSLSTQRRSCGVFNSQDRRCKCLWHLSYLSQKRHW